LNLRSLSAACRAGNSLVDHFLPLGLNVQVREESAGEFEAAAKLSDGGFVRRITLDRDLVAGLLDTLEIEAGNHRDPFTEGFKHSTRARLRLALLLDSGDTSVARGDLVFEFLLLLHLGFQPFGDPLLLFQLTPRLSFR